MRHTSSLFKVYNFLELLNFSLFAGLFYGFNTVKISLADSTVYFLFMKKPFILIAVTVTLCCSVVLAAETNAPAAGESALDSTLLERLSSASGFEKIPFPEELITHEKSSSFPVIVLLNNPKPAVDWQNKSAKKRYLEANKALQADFLKSIPSAEINYRYETFPGLSLRLTEGEILQLMTDDRVEKIEPVVSVEMYDIQAHELIRATTPKSHWDGAGITIAILDSGVDYTHPQLGNGPFPNSKVVSGIDVANLDFDPIPAPEAGVLNSKPSAHGTHCAGIAAGDVFLAEDYNGGLAPAAKISAVKVFRDGIAGTDSATVTAGIDWCIVNQNVVPESPILVLNMSLGGGKFTTACDNLFSSYRNVINNALDAGITVVVASGNDGFCNAVGAPACINGVITVGAAYDESFGNDQFNINSSSCYPGGTLTINGLFINEVSAPRKVTGYSNTSALVSIVGPSSNAATLDLVGVPGHNATNFRQNFNGTSAAAPYVAATVALLQQASLATYGHYLFPSQVHQLLTLTGDTVTDSKNGGLEPAVTIPFLNVEASINAATTLLDEALEIPNKGFFLGGEGTWEIDESTFIEGGSSIRSSAMSNSQQSWIEFIAPEATHFSFLAKVSSQSSADYFNVSINNQPVLTKSGEQDWADYSFPVALGDKIRFTFARSQNQSAELNTAWIDHFRYSVDVPLMPFSPTPANAATGVSFNQAILSWNNGVETQGVSHDFYFGTDPLNLERFAEGLTDPQYDPLLADQVTYYWQVISTNRLGQTPGPVWSFTTAANTPPTSPVLKPVLAAELAAPSIDPDGDTVLYQGRWESSGPDMPVNFSPPADQTVFVLQEEPGRSFTVGETWTLTLTSQDSFGDIGGSATATFIIGEQSVRFEGWTFD